MILEEKTPSVAKAIIDRGDFFLLERDLFHEIDQIFGQDVGISGWNVMFHTPVREFRRLESDRKILFPDPKICQNPQNGLSQKWPQIGRSYLYGRDTAAFRFWGLKRKVFGHATQVRK